MKPPTSDVVPSKTPSDQSDSQIHCQEIGSAETRDIGDASIHEVPKATGPKSDGKDLYLGDDLRKSQEYETGFGGR